MRLMRARRLLAFVIALAALAGAALIARPYAHGLSFVIRAADVQGTLRSLANADTGPITERRIEIDARVNGDTGVMGARLYRPNRQPRRLVLLVSGLHPSGIDEPRLVGLARQLALSGLAVVTPDIPQLSRFEITPAITDEIEASASWLYELSKTSGVTTGDGRIGMIGISFSGGLSVVAAGRPALRDRVAYVLSFGGHDDLPRVLRYLCTGVEPPAPRLVRLKPDTTETSGQPVSRPPHDYGVAMILLGLADRVVPSAQVTALRAAVLQHLRASALDTVDKPQAALEFAALRELAKKLPEPSSTLLRYVNDRDVVHLGPRLLPYVGVYGGDKALSASKSPKPSAPVFMLHGLGDNVIPPIESEYLAEDLRGHAPVRLLLSGLISHAEADRPMRVGDVAQLASFWGDLLAR